MECKQDIMPSVAKQILQTIIPTLVFTISFLCGDCTPQRMTPSLDNNTAVALPTDQENRTNDHVSALFFNTTQPSTMRFENTLSEKNRSITTNTVMTKENMDEIDSFLTSPNGNNTNTSMTAEHRAEMDTFLTTPTGKNTHTSMISEHRTEMDTFLTTPSGKNTRTSMISEHRTEMDTFLTTPTGKNTHTSMISEHMTEMDTFLTTPNGNKHSSTFAEHYDNTIRSSSVQNGNKTSKALMTDQDDKKGGLVLLSANDTRCGPVEEVLTDEDGRVSWADPDPGCRGIRTWMLKADPDFGIGFQFHDVQMTQGRQLEIQSYNATLGAWTTERRFLENNHSESSFNVLIDLSPLLLNHSTVRIVANSARQREVDDPPSFFNVSYFAQEKSTMPSFELTEQGVTMGVYHCLPGAVPKSFLCNMVKECENNEDEAHCDYTDTGCEEGWVPYQKQCLIFNFIYMVGCRTHGACDEQYKTGYPLPTLPDNAERLCEYVHDATHASVTDDAGLSLVAAVIQQSGFRSVSLYVRKFLPTNRKLSHPYRFSWQWGGKGGAVAYDRQDLQTLGPEFSCAMLDIYPRPHFIPTDCDEMTRLVFPDGMVCSKPNSRLVNDTAGKSLQPRKLSFAPAIMKTGKSVSLKTCSDGSHVHVFERCKWGDGKTGVEWSPHGFTLFKCRFGLHVHYSLVCNGMGDCADSSDEENCIKPRFEPLLGRGIYPDFVCENSQVLRRIDRCDSKPDCFDGTDEEECTSCRLGWISCPGIGCVSRYIGLHFLSCPRIISRPAPVIPVPGVALFTVFGVPEIAPVEANNTEHLFECRPGFYLPTYMLGNGETDCSDGRDEDVLPENIVCPGYYRCQGYGICVHPDFLCDNIIHCPNKDDELYCSRECPINCTCEVWAFSCQQMFYPSKYPHTRYLDLSGVKDLSFEEFYFMEFLQLLNLSRCGLVNLTLSLMPGLKVLDLSLNRFVGLASLSLTDMLGLTYLDLTGNPFVSVLDSTFTDFLRETGMVNLESLILQGTSLHEIKDSSFGPLSKLTKLDLRGSPVDIYDVSVFQGLTELAVLHADDPKLCCPYFHPNTIEDCNAPRDELSTCDDLLRTDFFRVSLWIMAVLAVFGNGGVMIYRFVSSDKGSPSFRVLVMNLCAADILMGLYVVMVGSADVRFRSVYVSVEREWRHSALCTVTGLLAFVSSEVSTFVICLITLDRLLAVGFPLKKHLHLKAKHCVAGCAVAWLLAVLLSVVPLLAGMVFYDVNAVCLPLPITRQSFSGQGYAFAVFVLLNFLLILLIGAGQLFIYRSVLQAGSASGVQRKEQETRIARQLFLVVFTDFCCWFPVGLMGLLAASGVPIPGQVNVWTAVFLLPVNSALNPFLYTLNAALERRRKRVMAEKTKRMVSNLQAVIPKWPQAVVEDTARICIKTKLVDPDKVRQWIGDSAHTEEENYADKSVVSDFDTRTTSVSEN